MHVVDMQNMLVNDLSIKRWVLLEKDSKIDTFGPIILLVEISAKNTSTLTGEGRVERFTIIEKKETASTCINKGMSKWIMATPHQCSRQKNAETQMHTDLEYSPRHILK